MPVKLSLCDAAVEWANRGFFIFPCVPLGKKPATANGARDATTDAEVIRAWWQSNPDYNIGVSLSRSGMFAIDADPPRGESTLASLELEHGLLPRTLTFKTPRGGTHYWFKGRLASSVGTDRNGLGPKLDTRGYPNGYVLLPPSHVVDTEKGIDGVYTQTTTEEIADGPAWIAAELGHQREHYTAENPQLDLPANIERAEELLRRYVGNGDVAIQGAGGDDRTYRLACELLNLGLRPATAFKCIRQIWNPACEPIWDDEELAAKVRNAAEYSQNDMGAWAIAPGAETFAAYAASLPIIREPVSRSRYYPYELSDTEEFQPPEWLIPNIIPKRGTVQIVGQKKSFKTFLTLDMALGLAAEAHPVVYIAGENASALVLKHVPAWCLEHTLNPLMLPFRIIREMPHAVFPDEMAELIAEIKKAEVAPAVVVIDTATRALRGLDENSAKDMGQFSAACEMIQRELDCTVIIIRHTGKDASRGGRGSNVLEGDFDTVLEVERQDGEQGRKSMFCTLTVRDQRNAAEREEPFAFEMIPIGGSLVPRAISAAEHSRAVAQEDPFNRQRVGAALALMNATEQAQVPTHALAMELTPQIHGETFEQHAEQIKRTERALRLRANGFLSGYCAGEGSKLRWFIAPPGSD